jgi:diguanylate cyclase (GGDEF)-like protein
MIHSNFLKIILALSIMTLVLFPLYTIFFQNPSFYDLLKENIVNEAVSSATQLTSVLIVDQGVLSSEAVSDELLGQIEALKKDAHFIKLKLYTQSGKVIFSTDQEEIGKFNKEPYLQAILEGGETRSNHLQKNTMTSEGKNVNRDIVETYVPIVRGGNKIGVFEIYHDITEEKQKLQKLINRSSAILFTMAVVLLAAVLIGIVKENQYVNDQKRIKEELHNLSISDELTGLYNRRGFFTLAEQQIKMEKRKSSGMLLVSADLNGLKSINDNHGHHEGDRALVEASAILQETFRESDIVARIGGDEFVVLITEKPEINPGILFTRLEKNLVDHNAKMKRPYKISISVGIAHYNPASVNPLDDMLIQADKRMYEHKRKNEKPEKLDSARKM